MHVSVSWGAVKEGDSVGVWRLFAWFCCGMKYFETSLLGYEILLHKQSVTFL